MVYNRRNKARKKFQTILSEHYKLPIIFLSGTTLIENNDKLLITRESEDNTYYIIKAPGIKHDVATKFRLITIQNKTNISLTELPISMRTLISNIITRQSTHVSIIELSEFIKSFGVIKRKRKPHKKMGNYIILSPKSATPPISVPGTIPETTISPDNIKRSSNPYKMDNSVTSQATMMIDKPIVQSPQVQSPQVQSPQVQSISVQKILKSKKLGKRTLERSYTDNESIPIESVDLNNIYPYLKHDGILITHDTRHHDLGEDMMSAVNTFTQDKDIEMLTLPYGYGLTFFRNKGNTENKVDLTWRKR